MDETKCQWCGHEFEFECESERHEAGTDEYGMEYDAWFVDCPKCSKATCTIYAS